MNYQEKYYENKYKEEIEISTIRQSIHKMLDSINGEKYSKNGRELETEEDYRQRIEWYYDNTQRIEVSSKQELYRTYINNRNFASPLWARSLSDQLNLINIGATKMLINKFTNLYNYRNVTVITYTKEHKSYDYDLFNRYEDLFLEDLTNTLWSQGENDRILYCKYIITSISKIFKNKRCNEEKEFTKTQQNDIRGYFTRKYTTLFNNLRDTLFSFEIDLDKIVKELDLENVLYLKLGSLSNSPKEIEIFETPNDIIEEAKIIQRKIKFNSKFTQGQIATLFRLMREKELFVMTDTELANLILELVGGSHQHTRTLIGGVNAKHINMTLTSKEQAEEMQSILQSIIELIEKEKKAII